MNQARPSPEGIAGIKATQAKQFKQALSYLKTAISQGDTHTDVLMAAAFSARAELDFTFCLSAIDRYLLIQPKDINANLIKADALNGLGKIKAAASFYAAAISLAPDISQLPESHAREIKRAQAACDKAAAHFANSMSAYLYSTGLNNSTGESRIAQTVDLMMGRKEVFLQKPSKLYIPELPQKQFYEPADFAWAQAFVDSAAEIKAELDHLIATQVVFSPYMDHNPDAPAISNSGLEKDARWSALHLFKDGIAIDENIEKCPNTMKALEALPLAHISGRSPNILFSWLKAGAHIPPHHGQTNARLLVHLPLVVPVGCELRVGNQVRKVEENKLMIFDDSIEHEARNTSDSDRIVLIVDIWRPELSQEERQVIAGIFEKIESIE